MFNNFLCPRCNHDNSKDRGFTKCDNDCSTVVCNSCDKEFCKVNKKIVAGHNPNCGSENNPDKEPCKNMYD